MKIFRAAFFVLLSLVTIGIASLWTVSHFMQSDTLKLIAKKQLSSVIQQETTLDGDINWRIFPRPGLHLTKVRIGDPDNKEALYSVNINNLLFHIKLIPLLRGKLIFDKLILDGFTLKVNANRLNNTSLPKSSEKKLTASSQSTAPNIAARVALNSLLLTNGKIILVQNDKQLLLKNVRLEAMLHQDENITIPLQLKATIKTSPQSFPFSGSISYKGTVKVPKMLAHFSLKNLILDGQALLQHVHIGLYDVTQINTHLHFQDSQLELNPLTLSLYNGESVGQLKYQFDTQALTFNQTGTALQAEPFFQQLLNVQPARLMGLLDFSAHGDAKLNTPGWHTKMSIAGNFTLHHGTLSYINLPAVAEEAKKTIYTLASDNLDKIKETLSQLSPFSLARYTGKTDFQLLTIQYQTNGNGTLNYNLLLETEALNLKGDGTLDMASQAINANLMAYLNTKDKTTQAMQQLIGPGFPFIVKGTLSEPVIHVDRRIIERMLSNNVLSKKITKPLKKLKKHIKPLDYVTPFISSE